MNTFSRTHAVLMPALIYMLGMSVAWAVDDERAKQDAPKPVSAATRSRIVETLLAVVGDENEQTDVRISAARSLGTQIADREKAGVKAREALMAIVEAEDADPGLQLAAIGALRAADVELTKEQLNKIGEALWGIVIKAQGSDEREQRLGAAVLAFNRYYSNGKCLPAPEDVAAVQALLAFSRGGTFPHRGRRYSQETYADGALEVLTETAGGVRVLIKTLDSLEMESPDEISIAQVNQFRRSSRTNDLREIREQIARHLFEENREKLMALLGDTRPRNEKIAQLLLKAASHENPDIRAAAIEALGNEIPEGNAIPERDSKATAAPVAPS